MVESSIFALSSQKDWLAHQLKSRSKWTQPSYQTFKPQQENRELTYNNSPCAVPLANLHSAVHTCHDL